MTVTLAVKCAVHLLSVNHGIDEPIQHNSRTTNPLVHEIRYCMGTKIATPLTFYLLWDKIRLSGRRKCSNTYFLPNICWCIKCNNILCQSMTYSLLVMRRDLMGSFRLKVWFYSLPNPGGHEIRCKVSHLSNFVSGTNLLLVYYQVICSNDKCILKAHRLCVIWGEVAGKDSRSLTDCHGHRMRGNETAW